MKKFTADHLEILREVWPEGSREDIQKALPDFSYGTLSNKAYRNGIKCTRSRKKVGDLSPLLSETHEAYYWLGFITADGHLSTQNQLVVMISERDKEHLEKMAKYLGVEVKYPYGTRTDRSGFSSTSPLVRIACQDQVIVPKIREKLGFDSTNKTYIGFDLTLIPEDFRDTFLVGFIDGDGHIQISKGITIQNHKAYSPLYSYLNSTYEFSLYKGRNKDSIAGRFSVSQSKTFLEVIDAHRLPAMERKWNKVRSLTKADTLPSRNNLIHELSKTHSAEVLSEKFNLSKNTIWYIIKKESNRRE